MEQPNTDANTSTESSTVENTVTPGSPAEPANVSPETTSEPKPFHEHPRWQELIKEKNQYKSKLQELERRYTQPNQPDPRVVQAVQDLVNTGVDKGVAEVLVRNSLKIAAQVAHRTVQPLERKTASQEIDSWFSKMKQTNKDIQEYQPKMFEHYSKLPDNVKDLVVSSPQGLSMLYSHVKVQDLDRLKAQSYQKGADEAYKNKQTKSAVTSTPGASQPNTGKQSLKSILDMDNNQFKANAKAIWQKAMRGELE